MWPPYKVFVMMLVAHLAGCEPRRSYRAILAMYSSLCLYGLSFRGRGQWAFLVLVCLIGEGLSRFDKHRLWRSLNKERSDAAPKGPRQPDVVLISPHLQFAAKLYRLPLLYRFGDTLWFIVRLRHFLLYC
jgi:hypothetical protein